MAVFVVLILGLTGCIPADPGASSAPSPAGPSTTVVLPRSTVTTIAPSSSPAPSGQAQWTFVVVRHANRAGGTNDPPLTEAGELRARRLADLIFSYPGVATYATRYRRARDTARPTAELWDVPITTYDMKLTPAELINQIKLRHPTGAILIVGHSDTVPRIVAELCRCPINPASETDYANRYEVALRADSSVLRFDHQTSY